MRRIGGDGEWLRPESVVERRVDPATGLVLADGCRPERGDAVTELFLEDALPARTCPAGEEEGRGFLDRIADGVASFVRGVPDFFKSLYGRGGEADERERYLGKPRLPRASDVPRVDEPDTGRVEPPAPLGVPLDSVPGWGDVPVRTPADTGGPGTPGVPDDTLESAQPAEAADTGAVVDTGGVPDTGAGPAGPPADTGGAPTASPDSVGR